MSKLFKGLLKSRFGRRTVARIKKKEKYARVSKRSKEMNELVYEGRTELMRLKYPGMSRAMVKSTLRNVDKRAKRSARAIIKRSKIKRVK